MTSLIDLFLPSFLPPSLITKETYSFFVSFPDPFNELFLTEIAEQVKILSTHNSKSFELQTVDLMKERNFDLRTTTFLKILCFCVLCFQLKFLCPNLNNRICSNKQSFFCGQLMSSFLLESTEDPSKIFP